MTRTPIATSIIDLFARTCAAHPHAVALEIPPNDERARTLRTYAELDRASSAIARLLSPSSLSPDSHGESVVILALARSDPRLYAAMLGVMRAGYAYCAVDPLFPARQAADIVADCTAIAIIADPARGAEIATAGVPPVITPAIIDRAIADHLDGAESLALPTISPTSLAYVIYTSGTTGRPKGVEIEHHSILNLVSSDVSEFGLGVGDRIAQGSSASYDSSLEEIWMAWAVGATVLVMDDETARLGPDLLAWLQRERVTVLCPPPTLLRTLDCDDPQRALPEIRLLYVGGEALPPDLADLWSRGRRLENGYGPTECTVTCLRTTVRPGEEVTIGRSIPGTTAFVIDPDHAQLYEITDQLRGELVIGGASLARGYRGQPETTAARFIAHPSLGRVYRTGDLVHRDSSGTFHYHGRIDAQVKLRGYRIELGAIEARLAAHPSVLESACTVEGEDAQRRLVAHVVMREECIIDADALRSFIGETLAHYMVPTAIAAIDHIPRTISGKIDRKRLPIIAASTIATNHVAPVTDTQRIVARAFASALGQSGDVSIEADLFDELGLDSLTIALAISRMRASLSTRAATVRMAYRHRTARSIADALDEIGRAEKNNPARQPSAPLPAIGTSRPILATTLQALFLLTLLLGASQILWIPHAGERMASALYGPFATGLALASIAALLVAGFAVATLTLAVASKWILIGRYRPMRVRAWSMMHVRHWIVVRFAALAPWDLFESVGLGPAVLSLFGAKIGRRVHIHRGVRLNGGGWDLITLEDDATVGQDASLRVVEFSGGTLVFGKITVGRGATLETRAGMSAGAELGEGCVVRPLSNLVPGPVHTHTMLDGVPAEPVGAAMAAPMVALPGSRARQIIVAIGLFLMLVGALLLPWLLAFAVFGISADESMHDTLFGESSLLPTISGFARLAGAVVSAGVITVLLQAVLVRMLGKVPTGSFSLGSFAASKMSLQSALVEAAGKWLSGTIMWPMWLNLAGARIGPGCEISTVTDVIPSTVSIGRETFFADGIYLGGPRLRAGTATVERVELGESCFIGNHAVLPAGTTLASGTLVGISTRGDNLPHEPGLSWFGHPAFRLPRREIVHMPRELTHEPTLIRRVNRWIWELARFALPIGPVLVGLTWFRAMELASTQLSPALFRLVALPLGVLAALATLVFGIVAMKWLLIGRVKPGTHALWSCWCSRWDFLYVAWGMWASVPLTFLDGTLLLVAYLRLMGCKIGRRALLGGGFSQVVDPDMLHFGDDVTVDALFQAHTFEDRVLKVDHVHLRDGCTIGANTVILYGADIGPRATVAPHSVVMKRETLLADTRYQGAPTQPA